MEGISYVVKLTAVLGVTSFFVTSEYIVTLKG